MVLDRTQQRRRPITEDVYGAYGSGGVRPDDEGRIAPALRRLGFKGSGQRYELPSDTHWAIVGFQKFSWSDQDKVEFTLNLTVTGRDEWMRARERRRHLSERPQANAGAFVGWEERIGALMPDDAGETWIVTGDLPTEPVAGQVVAAVERFVLPAMRARISRGKGRLDDVRLVAGLGSW